MSVQSPCDIASDGSRASKKAIASTKCLPWIPSYPIKYLGNSPTSTTPSTIRASLVSVLPVDVSLMLLLAIALTKSIRLCLDT
ncbi:hypothetical protein [Nostoc sp.]|uniref:hypothetical protein n=1 Tax=Nostoc sp. TaxID=1180 RepID=UPI002FFB58FB